MRNINADNIARALAEKPALYTRARTCLASLPRVADRLERTFRNLLEIYPEADKPPVTIPAAPARVQEAVLRSSSSSRSCASSIAAR